MRRAPYKTANDLVAKAKAAPGKLNCGAGTITTKLTCVLFNEKSGLNTVLISYQRQRQCGARRADGQPPISYSTARPPNCRSSGPAICARSPSSTPAPFPPVPTCRRCDAATGVDLGDLDGVERSRRAARHAARHDRQVAAEVAKVSTIRRFKAKAEAVGIYPVSTTPGEFAAFITRSGALAGDREEKRHAF